MRWMVRLSLVGLSHKTADVALREQASLARGELAPRLGDVMSLPCVDEALALCTCNRSELYLALNGCPDGTAQELFGRLHGSPPEVFDGHLYVRDGLEAVRHVFSVAGGVDSMVFGETEIVGQLKQALDDAQQAGTASRVLLRLGQRALSVGKRIRTETSVDRGCMSVASVAADLAGQVFGDLARARVLLLGAGEVGGLVAQRMVDCGAVDLTVASRTTSRAAALAQRFDAQAIDFGEFPEAIKRSDIVISCTSSPHPLISAERVRAATVARHRGPLFVVDLAMPRDAEPAVGQLGDVYLYDLDDLEGLARQCEEQRRCELPRVEAIVEEEAQEFMAWVDSLEDLPLMVALRGRVEAIRREEVARLVQAPPGLTTRQLKAFRAATKRIGHRLLADPARGLRAMADKGRAEEGLAAARQMFRIEGYRLLGVVGPAGDRETGHE